MHESQMQDFQKDDYGWVNAVKKQVNNPLNERGISRQCEKITVFENRAEDRCYLSEDYFLRISACTLAMLRAQGFLT